MQNQPISCLVCLGDSDDCDCRRDPLGRAIDVFSLPLREGSVDIPFTLEDLNKAFREGAD